MIGVFSRFCAPAALALVAVSAQAATFEELSARAAAARDANNIPGAIQAYRQALKLNPQWAEGWWFAGTLAYDSDQFADGRDAFTHFVVLDAKAAPGWSLLGLCEFETGDYAGALGHIERGLSLGEETPGAMEPRMEEVLRFHEAMLLTRAGLFDQALSRYMWFARKQIRNPQLLTAVGVAALRRAALVKDVSGGEREAASAAGEAAYAWMARDFKAADSSFQTLVARYGAVPDVHYLYGSYLVSSRPDIAMAELRRELEINPASADARAMIALLYVRHEDDASAFPFAEKAAHDGPSTPLAQYIYGLLLGKRGDAANAIEPLKTAVKLDPANVEYHMALATAYSRAGRAADARKERVETLALAQKDSPNAH